MKRVQFCTISMGNMDGDNINMTIDSKIPCPINSYVTYY